MNASQTPHPPPPFPAVRPAPRRAIPERPGRVLVADDEHLAAASLMRDLRSLGYSPVGPARDGEHAVELAFATRPDLALLDVRMMTESDGIEAADALFNVLVVPVVMVSAFSDPRQIVNAAAAGVFGYLVKPVTRDQLAPAIEVAWARFNGFLSREIEGELMRRRLEDIEVIERAKWSLAERLELDEGQAMRQIRKRARDSGRSLAAVAHDILAG